nr:hypothetical protein GCM10025732_00250 [Glycomyces mayteni]
MHPGGDAGAAQPRQLRLVVGGPGGEVGVEQHEHPPRLGPAPGGGGQRGERVVLSGEHVGIDAPHGLHKRVQLLPQPRGPHERQESGLPERRERRQRPPQVLGVVHVQPHQPRGHGPHGPQQQPRRMRRIGVDPQMRPVEQRYQRGQ